MVYTLLWACKSMSSYFTQMCPNFNLSWERPGDLTGTGLWGQRPLSGRWQGIEIYLYGEYRVFYGLLWKEAALIWLKKVTLSGILYTLLHGWKTQGPMEFCHSRGWQLLYIVAGWPLRLNASHPSIPCFLLTSQSPKLVPRLCLAILQLLQRRRFSLLLCTILTKTQTPASPPFLHHQTEPNKSVISSHIRFKRESLQRGGAGREYHLHTL